MPSGVAAWRARCGNRLSSGARRTQNAARPDLCENERGTWLRGFVEVLRRCGECQSGALGSLKGTGIMVYVGSNTMNCNSWCGRGLAIVLLDCCYRYVVNSLAQLSVCVGRGTRVTARAGRPQFCDGRIDAAESAGARISRLLSRLRNPFTLQLLVCKSSPQVEESSEWNLWVRPCPL